MSKKVSVKTNGDDYALLEHERAVVEFTKDGNSPACPNSWTWYAYFDGCKIEGDCTEESLATSVANAMRCLTDVINELMTIRDYLMAYGAFGKLRRYREGERTSSDKDLESRLASMSKDELIEECMLWRETGLSSGRKYAAIYVEKLALCKRIGELCQENEQLRHRLGIEVPDA